MSERTRVGQAAIEAARTYDLIWYSPCGYERRGLFAVSAPIPSCPQCYSTAWSTLKPMVIPAPDTLSEKPGLDVERLLRIEAAARVVASMPSGNISGSKRSPGNRDRLPERRAAFDALRVALASTDSEGRSEKGQSVVEYSLIGVLVVIVVIVVLSFLGTNVLSLLTDIGSKV